MKSRQRRSSKLPAANPVAPLTEAQTAFAAVLGQCLAKEWIRQTGKSPKTSQPTKPDSRPPTVG
ncbi:MAG: hypothetical protein NT013_21650 [Planctomycetia bacterium]|nr:hypothetical protein [Planctomycetia bacterium]